MALGWSLLVYCSAEKRFQPEPAEKRFQPEPAEKRFQPEAAGKRFRLITEKKSSAERLERATRSYRKKARILHNLSYYYK